MFGADRQSIRRYFIDCWRKRLDGQPLEPLERLVVEVLLEHPEYHPLLGSPEEAIERDFPPEQGHPNPFLHLGMHISLREQLASDRPPGIRDLYQKITAKTADSHETEHRLMECLGLILWEAQRDNRMPDDKAYLECIRRLGQG
ncbi:MAG: DUF1841 family protein [Gammaproteobacteria bacterium]|nr:DUF1841 family protein [Gammaproteobacteria bacterium]MBU1656068.1 DUF1841 family protein [Gammaproteobacteria bacterium]MBU1960337.1 DUF1841 family protein [Gammaproteobacteria bacterium]